MKWQCISSLLLCDATTQECTASLEIYTRWWWGLLLFGAGSFTRIFLGTCGWGWGFFQGGGHLQPCGPLLWYFRTPLGNNPVFSNLGSCAACWARFLCHHELWPSSLSHPLSSLNITLGLAGENITRNLLSISFDLFYKICPFHFAFLIFFSIAIFSPYFALNVFIFPQNGISFTTIIPLLWGQGLAGHTYIETHIW